MYTNPGFYQSPYTQPAQNPYMDRLAQMQPPQLPRDALGAVVVNTPEERERANRLKTWAGIIGKTS